MGGAVDPAGPHRAVAEQEPPRADGDGGAVANRPVEPSGIAAGWMPRTLMLAAAVGVGWLIYPPAVRSLFDAWQSLAGNDLVWLLSGVALAARWWFRNVVWPDDLPRGTQRRDEGR